jgi:hypothetical protein
MFDKTFVYLFVLLIAPIRHYSVLPRQPRFEPLLARVQAKGFTGRPRQNAGHHFASLNLGKTPSSGMRVRFPRDPLSSSQAVSAKQRENQHVPDCAQRFAYERHAIICTKNERMRGAGGLMRSRNDKNPTPRTGNTPVPVKFCRREFFDAGPLPCVRLSVRPCALLKFSHLILA